MKTPLCELFGIDYPIFAFSRSPGVVAAVSRAGGMGMLGAVSYSTDQLKEILDWIDANVEGKPYGVDVVMPAKYTGSESQAGGVDPAAFEAMIPERHKAFINELLDRYGVPELPEGEDPWHALLGWTEEMARPQVELALSYPIKLLANALGPPPPDIVEQAHAQGVKVAALTGSTRHAQRHQDSGVDILIAAGTEAGGHCGEISTLVLVPEIVDVAGDTPVLAAGGIGCGRQIAASLALGAQGVWMGSLWLTSEECETIPVLKEKLVEAGSRDTVRSRALSGKPARQLKTAWSDEWADPDNPSPLPMPLHFMATAEATSRIHRFAPDTSTRTHELLTSPVGQIVGRMNSVRPVAEIMAELVAEYQAAAERLAKLR